MGSEMCIRDRLLSSNILSGPRLGNTNASTGRVISPKVRLKRMYPRISNADPSALFNCIAPGGTCFRGKCCSIGCDLMKDADIHGTSAAVSIVRSDTG